MLKWRHETATSDKPEFWGTGKQIKTTAFREGIAKWRVVLQSLLLGISLIFQFPQSKHGPVALNLPASSGDGGMEMGEKGGRGSVR